MSLSKSCINAITEIKSNSIQRLWYKNLTALKLDLTVSGIMVSWSKRYKGNLKSGQLNVHIQKLSDSILHF